MLFYGTIGLCLVTAKSNGGFTIGEHVISKQYVSSVTLYDDTYVFACYKIQYSYIILYFWNFQIQRVVRHAYAVHYYLRYVSLHYCEYIHFSRYGK